MAENKEQRTIVVNFETKDYDKTLRQLNSFEKRYKQLMRPASGVKLSRADADIRRMFLDSMRRDRNMLNRLHKDSKKLISRTKIKDLLKPQKNTVLKDMAAYYRQLEKETADEAEREKQAKTRYAKKWRTNNAKLIKEQAMRIGGHEKNQTLKDMASYYKQLEKTSRENYEKQVKAEEDKLKAAEKERIRLEKAEMAAKEKAEKERLRKEKDEAKAKEKAQKEVLKRLKEEAKIKAQLEALEEKERQEALKAKQRADNAWRKKNASIIKGKMDILSGKKKNEELSQMAEYYKQLEKQAADEAKAQENVAKAEEKERQANRKLAQKQMRRLKKRGSAAMRRKQKNEAREIASAMARREGLKKSGLKALDNLREKVGGLANIATQAVGELTMFAGAITMVGYMASSAFAKILKVGEAFANVEKTYLVGAGFRERLYQQGGVSSLSEFDSALVKATKFTGKSTFQTAEMLARTGSTIKDAGGKVSMKNLMNVVESAYGLSAVTGDDPDKLIGKILESAKKGKDTSKLGVKNLKLTKSMDTNLEIIAKAVKDNPIAATAINKGSIEANINRIKSAPNQLLSRVYGAHMNQTKRIFSNIDDTIFSVFNDPEVTKHWSKTLTNFEQDANSVFKKEKIKKAAMDAAEWAAELSAIGKNMLEGALWVLGNKETIINGVKEIGKWWIAIQAFKIGSTLLKTIADVTVIMRSIGGLIMATNAATATATAATGAATLGGALAAVGTGLTVLAAGVAAMWAGGKLGKFLGDEVRDFKEIKKAQKDPLYRHKYLKQYIDDAYSDKKLSTREKGRLKIFDSYVGETLVQKELDAFRLNPSEQTKQVLFEAIDKAIDKTLDNQAKLMARDFPMFHLPEPESHLSKSGRKYNYTGAGQYNFLQQSFLNPNATFIYIPQGVTLGENVPYSDLGLMSTAGGAVN